MSNIQEVIIYIFCPPESSSSEWLNSASTPNYYGIAANLFEWAQLINEQTRLENYLVFLSNNIPDVVDLPIRNSDHSSISFSLKLD